jgi:hypothetical protein
VSLSLSLFHPHSHIFIPMHICTHGCSTKPLDPFKEARDLEDRKRELSSGQPSRPPNIDPSTSNTVCTQDGDDTIANPARSQSGLMSVFGFPWSSSTTASPPPRPPPPTTIATKAKASSLFYICKLFGFGRRGYIYISECVCLLGRVYIYV